MNQLIRKKMKISGKKTRTYVNPVRYLANANINLLNTINLNFITEKA